MSSVSGASYYTTHGTRRSMYSGVQSRVSNAEDSEPSRYSRNGLSAILESERHEEDSESSRHLYRIHPGIIPPVSDSGESDSEYGSRVRRSMPSQAGLSAHRLNPRDSISNRGFSPSDSGQMSRNISLRGSATETQMIAMQKTCTMVPDMVHTL